MICKERSDKFTIGIGLIVSVIKLWIKMMKNQTISDDGSKVGSAKVREVIVRPLTARRETVALILMIAVIIALMGLRFNSLAVVDAKKTLKSYQRIDGILKNQAPTLYRSLVSVVGDILDIREELGQWPEVKSLQDEALPPFANDFLPAGLKGYVWTQYKTGESVDYYGVNQNVLKQEKAGVDPLENTFVLRILDLKAQTHPHPHQGDHSSSNSRFIYQVWMYPEVRDYPGENLKEKGWKWVVNASDSNSGATGVISEQPEK